MFFGLRVRVLIFLCFLPFFVSAEELSNSSLDGFIKSHDPTDKTAALYVIERCSGLFIYLAGISADDYSEKGRKFHENSQNAILRTALARSNYIQNKLENSYELMQSSDKKIADFAIAYSKFSDQILDSDTSSTQDNLILLDLKSCSDTFIKQSKLMK